MEAQPSETPIRRHTELGDWKDVVRITASHCCVCRRELTDAESVEHGIGPICSRRYYDPLHTPTARDIAEAMGSLAASTLPERVVDAIIARRDNARQACNILVYWASAHYDNKQVVFRCAAIIRDFGYVELANKLEEDRTVVSVRIATVDEAPEESVIVLVPGQRWNIEKAFRAVPGALRRPKVAHKFCWAFPKDQQTYVEALLGYYYPDKLAALAAGSFGRLKAGIYRIPRRSRQELETCQAKVNGSSTPPPSDVRIVDAGDGAIQFWAPFDGAWLTEMKRVVPARFRRWSGAYWSIGRSYLRETKALAKTHYGADL